MPQHSTSVLLACEVPGEPPCSQAGEADATEEQQRWGYTHLSGKGESRQALLTLLNL